MDERGCDFACLLSMIALKLYRTTGFASAIDCKSWVGFLALTLRFHSESMNCSIRFFMSSKESSSSIVLIPRPFSISFLEVLIQDSVYPTLISLGATDMIFAIVKLKVWNDPSCVKETGTVLTPQLGRGTSIRMLTVDKDGI